MSKTDQIRTIIKIRSDPVYFFKNIINIDPYPKQEEFIRNFYRHKYNTSLSELKKLILVLGQRCISADSLIETQNGLIRIQDLYIKNSTNPTNIHSNSINLTNVQVFNGEKFTPATEVIYAGKKRTLRITTQYGFSLDCSEDHKFLVFNGESFAWKPLKDIKLGEYLQVHRNTTPNGTSIISNNIKEKLKVCSIENKTNFTIPLQIFSELSIIIGMLIADGSISGKGKIYFTKEDQDLLSFYITGMKNQFNLNGKIYKYNDHHIAKTVELYCEGVRYFLELLGIGYWHSDTKEIPSCILNGTEELKISFLSGYFSCDGNAQVSKSGKYKKARITSTTTSKKLAYQLQNILLELGILSSISIGKSVEYGTRIKRENDAYTINVFGEEIINFCNKISFISQRKQTKLKEAYDYQLTRNTQGRKVPLHRELARKFYKCNSGNSSIWNNTNGTFSIDKQWDFYKGGSELIETLRDQNKLFLKIKSIEELNQYIDMYDLHVPEGNAYLANGMLVHNSGKTLIGAGLLLYEFHELISYDNPHAHYGVGINNKGEAMKLIGCTCVSTSKDQASDGVFGNVKILLRNSDYFQEYFLEPKHLKISELRIDYEEKMVFLQVKAPKIDTAAGYENKIVLYDEMDLMQYGSTSQKNDTRGSKVAAHNVYSKLNNSTQTFGPAGKIVAMSSLQRQDGIMVLAYNEALVESDALAISAKTWEVNPNPELSEAVLRERYKNRMDEFYRDFANMPEVGGSSLFPEKVRLNHSLKNVLLSNDPLPPEYNYPHVIAIDPAAHNDSFGIASAFMHDGKLIVDGARKFSKPLSKDSYIKPSDIQDFVNLQMNRLNVYAFVHDTPQYPNILEDVRDRWGVEPTQHHTDAESYGMWRELQNNIGELQLHVVYDESLELECNSLTYVERGISGKLNVDHPYKGSKDTADAVCNCIWYLATNPEQLGFTPFSTIQVF